MHIAGLAGQGSARFALCFSLFGGMMMGMQDSKWLHVADMIIREADIDALGGVHNSKYLEYFSHGSNRMISALGHDVHALHMEGIDCVIVKVELEFKQSLYLGDSIQVWSNLDFKGSYQTIFVQQIVKLPDLSVVATAKFFGCIMDMKAGEPQETLKLKQALEDYLATNQKPN